MEIEKIHVILTQLSELMGVEVKIVDDPKEQGKAVPAHNIDAIISKMMALFVFCGFNVPSSFAPAYNRVHADVEWWKQHFEAKPETPGSETEKGEG